MPENLIPPKLLNTSYSSLQTLHRCPRKFFLERLKPNRDRENNATLAFGHAVGEGIQSVLSGDGWNRTLIRMFLAWDVDIFDDLEDKDGKTFWFAVNAVEKFIQIRDTVLGEYEIARWTNPSSGEEEPAVELGFRITTPDGFKYRGFVDVVLRHKATGEFLVLELKTTKSRTPNEATYKNSGQALGYSIVLDSVAPGYSKYHVLYLVYSSVAREYTPMPFTKNYLQRAEWIHSFMLDVEIIKLYHQNQLWPKNGDSCFAFFRPCEFYQSCGMSDAVLVPESVRMQEPKPEAKMISIELTLMDLINSQLDRE